MLFVVSCGFGSAVFFFMLFISAMFMTLTLKELRYILSEICDLTQDINLLAMRSKEVGEDVQNDGALECSDMSSCESKCVSEYAKSHELAALRERLDEQAAVQKRVNTYVYKYLCDQIQTYHESAGGLRLAVKKVEELNDVFQL